MTGLSDGIAFASFVAASAAALFTWRQSSIATDALRAAEKAADAARVSAETSTALAEIEKDRHHRENRPRWIAVVERTKDYSVLWLRLALQSGDVDDVDVELLNFHSFTFREFESDHAEGVVDRTHAHFGAVREGRSAVWRIEPLASEAAWAKARIKVVARLGSMKWEDELRVEQNPIGTTGYEE